MCHFDGYLTQHTTSTSTQFNSTPSWHLWHLWLALCPFYGLKIPRRLLVIGGCSRVLHPFNLKSWYTLLVIGCLIQKQAIRVNGEQTFNKHDELWTEVLGRLEKNRRNGRGLGWFGYLFSAPMKENMYIEGFVQFYNQQPLAQWLWSFDVVLWLGFEALFAKPEACCGTSCDSGLAFPFAPPTPQSQCVKSRLPHFKELYVAMK